jgi:hypothetical protein
LQHIFQKASCGISIRILSVRFVSLHLRLCLCNALISTEVHLIQEVKDKAGVKSSRRTARSSAVEENFHDIVDQDERHIEEFVTEQFVTGILESKLFQALSLIIVFLQAAITGIRTDRRIVSDCILCNKVAKNYVRNT